MGQRSCASMADVSRRRHYRSSKRRADAISFLTNISLDGSCVANLSPQCISQRQKDDETDGCLSKKDDEKQGTTQPSSVSAALVSDLPLSSAAYNKSGGSSADNKALGSSERLSSGNSKAKLINAKNQSGRTRRLSGPAGEKSRSPPVSPLKLDSSKQCQRLIFIII